MAKRPSNIDDEIPGEPQFRSMRGPQVNTLVLSETSFGGELWEEVGNAMEILLRGGYACTVDLGMAGDVMITYAQSDGLYPAWMDRETLEAFAEWSRNREAVMKDNSIPPELLN